MSNVINVKKFIKENSQMNSNPKSVQSLKVLLESYGKKLIKKAEEKVISRKQKTLTGDDFHIEEKIEEEWLW